MKKFTIIIVCMLVLLVISGCDEQPQYQLKIDTEESEQVITVNQEKSADVQPTENAEEKEAEIEQSEDSKKEEQNPVEKETKTEIKTEVSSGVDFSDYPEVLLDGKTPKYKIIIGLDGPSTDVIAAVDLTTSITASLGSQTKESVSIMDAKVTTLKDNNYVIVGSPCWNRKTAEVLGLTYPACSNNGITGPELKILQNGDYHIILVTGSTAEDIRTAAKYLAQNKNLEGSAIKVN